MRYFKYIVIGFILGMTLYKSEAVSWFRIFEMFHFQSFHMFGIIFTAVAVGIIGEQLIKRFHLRNIKGEELYVPPKAPTYKRYIFGGIIFGMGWAMAGICPGPMFTLLGAGYTVLAVFLASAMFGTFVYGLLRDKLPH